MSNRLQIYLLGGLRVEHAGRILTRFRTRKTGSVLAYLAYHAPREVSREVLIEQFWPDDPPEKGRGSLNQAIYSLRQQLGSFSTLPDAFLIADRNSVRLNEALVWTDVEAFRRAASNARGGRGDRASALQEALDLYKGDFLEGFYDEWILSRAIELSAIRDALLALERPLPTLSSSIPADSPAPAPPLDNLPRIANPFIGREEELRQLFELHERSPLVVVVGLGGVGKTRLTLEFGRRLRETGREVWLIEYAAAPPDVSMVDEIVRQLHVTNDPSQPTVEALVSHFANRDATLILDNLEHLNEPEDEITTIFRRLTTVRIVATSRTRPRLHRAEALELAPLPTPSESASLEELKANPSATLFVDRAASAAPGFTLHARNADAIGELCQKLEGISLAIELAAARAQVYSVREMVEQMDQPLDFLVSRVQDRADRHRSLRSTIEWSYRRLTPWSRSIFPKLAVAKGGWTLPMAEQVLEAAGLSDLLHELVDASMLKASDAGRHRRFHMHEVLREFAMELLSGDELARLQEKRLERLIEFVEIDRPAPDGPGLKEWLDRLDPELENIRDCLGWAWANGRAELAIDLATKMSGYWDRRGYYREGCQWLEQAIAMPELSKETRAQVLHSAGGFRAVLGEHQVAQRHLEEATALYEQVGNTVRQASTLNHLGTIMHATGRHDEAESYFRESLELRRRDGTPSRLGIPLVNLANIAVVRCRYRQAEDLFMEALAIGRSENVPFLIQGVLNNLATLMIRTGRSSEAGPMLEEAWILDEELRHPHGLAHIQCTRSELFYRLGDHEQALIRADQAMAMFRELGEQRWWAHLMAIKGRILFLSGEIRAAEELIRQAVAGLAKVRERRMLAEARTLLAVVILERSEEEAARNLSEVFGSLSDDLEAPELHEAFVVLAALLGRRGEAATAAALAASAQRFYESTGSKPDPVVESLMERIYIGDAEPLETGEALALACEALRVLAPTNPG